MTISNRPNPGVDLDGLARRVHSTFPELDERGREVALATYRTLAYGEPVPDYAIAAVTGLDIMQVQDVMRPWPGVYRNDSGRIIGFWGLTLEEMGHPMRVDGVELFGWCAWDTLFLPGILERAATVRSSSAVTDEPIRVEVVDATVNADPPSTAMSFLDPARGSIDTDRIISTFCHHIAFFSSLEEGEEWVGSAGGDALVLTVNDAFELGRAFNRIRFGLD